MKRSLLPLILCLSVTLTSSAEDLTVSDSQWKSSVSNPGVAFVKVKLHPCLVERMLVDQELRGDKKETRQLRTLLQSGSLLFSWSLKETIKEGQRAWNFGGASVSLAGMIGPTSVGTKRNYHQLQVLEVKTQQKGSGYHYSFRLRVTLNGLIYDSFVSAQFSLPGPAQKKGKSSGHITWKGPFKKGCKNPATQKKAPSKPAKKP